jgi:hypothetical protein
MLRAKVIKRVTLVALDNFIRHQYFSHKGGNVSILFIKFVPTFFEGHHVNNSQFVGSFRHTFCLEGEQSFSFTFILHMILEILFKSKIFKFVAFKGRKWKSF